MPRRGFDLDLILAHAKEKGVGIWVWANWQVINDNGIEETFADFERRGIRGVKIDFLDRQDQWMVQWYGKVLRAAARHRIMVNFHGAFKPTVACFYGPTLQDGSTLDLSAWPGGWPVASSFTSGNTAISFADGATVKVKIGASRVGSARGTKILGWTTAPAVTFVPAEGECIGLRKKDDGLYLYKGLIILVR